MSRHLACSASFVAVLLAGGAAFGQAPAGMSPADRQFAQEAAIGGLYEVEVGKLAEHSTNAKVKDFGAKMVNDHTTANAQLKQVASAQGMALPQQLDERRQQMRDRLAALKGDDFDRAYIQEMVKDHDEDVKAFADEERTTSDTKLRQFVEQTLTVIKGHDQMARQIAGSMALKVNPTADRG